MRRRKYALTYLIALVFVSTVAFSYIERHTLFDSLYWTITVLTTVGFGDITPHTILGKLLFIFDAISGISTYVYLITSWQSSLVEARLERKLWKLTEANKSKSDRWLAGMLECGTVRAQACGTMFRQVAVQHIFRIKDSFAVQLRTDRTFEEQNVSAVWASPLA